MPSENELLNVFENWIDYSLKYQELNIEFQYLKNLFGGIYRRYILEIAKEKGFCMIKDQHLRHDVGGLISRIQIDIRKFEFDFDSDIKKKTRIFVRVADNLADLIKITTIFDQCKNREQIDFLLLNAHNISKRPENVVAWIQLTEKEYPGV